MAYQSFEEKIKDYDERSDMHYYVYFSSATYSYEVDAIQFKKKSDLKSERYRNEKYYSTYLLAQQAADRLNAKDTDVGHAFGRAASEFKDKLYAAQNMEGITDAQKSLIDATIKNMSALTKVMNNEHF
jgi:hypothetical protein